MSEDTENSRTPRGAAREIIIFFLRFLAASFALYLVYVVAGKFYTRLIALIASPFLSAFGYELVMDKANAITEEISLNPVVFLSLVIAVGAIPWRTKLKAAVIGAAILTALNSLTVFLAFVSFYRNSERLWTGSEFLSLTINFFVPILLWLVLLPIRSAFPFLRDNNA
ncbi:MAG: hypothetical protein NTW97_07935 [Candidatus Krumholzibacteria bacterium]|nr:hypothetical protein [Candidatus Krumholzibacteria bacterium]